ncbi:ammonium transporter [Leptospira sp. GIMC2001]|uniref:ammonium transporter n=1 Tax=Leptospira sp. GIMC2001 TaxID=1513297 RepID=UPI00234A25CE|nr:ammonium transporter [Leptospira sp. GIMC2001]WCL49267.1 ammonium transporter [Leptospira sp. GIMC2001]
MNTTDSLSSLMIILSTALVLFMQAGFLCVESGLTRSKNSINVAIKNITDFGIATIFYWLIGFGIMFGVTFQGWIGLDSFAPTWEGESADFMSGFFIFELVFCGTAATIVSGAVAERLKFQGYLMITFLVSVVIYPFVGHWIWKGLLPNSGEGWLEAIGFLDFAGSTVVHSVGGWVSLAALIVIGPRLGRYDENGNPVQINPSNLPMAMLGGIILWFGWIGFNGGSALNFDGRVTSIIMNTLLAAGAGLVIALFVGWKFEGYPEPIAPLNGSLAGLVAITAGCDAVTAREAIFIGAVGGALVKPAEALLNRFHIDDAVGAIPVHLVAGIWGTLAVGIFGKGEFLVQLLGVVIVGIFAFGLTYIILFSINKFFHLRVSIEEEKDGLNISEHKARTDLIDLLIVMEKQKKTGDLTDDVPVEPFTEVGQIAIQYNKVLAKVRETLAANEAARQQIEEAFENIALEQNRAERLLLNILPDSVAQELKGEENKVIAKSFQEVTILFADIVGFTRISESMTPHQVVEMLNMIISVFDRLTDKYGLEKIKTIGDAYMVVGGVPNPLPNHADAIAGFALDIQNQIKKFTWKTGEPLQMRMGINSGPVVAGVIGEKKFIYDIWGDAVNVASRLESHGIPGKIQISERTAKLLDGRFELEERGEIEVKGKGNLFTYFLHNRRSNQFSFS